MHMKYASVCLNKGRFIGIDQDGEALEAARKRLSEFEDKTSLVRSNYCEIDTILKDLNVEKLMESYWI